MTNLKIEGFFVAYKGKYYRNSVTTNPNILINNKVIIDKTAVKS